MDQPEWRVVDIAHELGIAKSTAHRLLTTLSSEGFVYKDPQTNLYSLGVSILELTNIVHTQLPIVEESTPILNALTEKTGESAHLAIREGSEVIYLQKIEHEYSISVATHTGRRNPLHCTGSGQAILAFESKDIVDEFLSGPLKKFTDYTITDPEKLKKRLEDIRKAGHVIEQQGFEEHIISIGAPIFNRRKEVIASVNIIGPIIRLRKAETQRRFADEVVSAADKITSLVALRQLKRRFAE